MNKKKWKPTLPEKERCMGCMVCMNQCRNDAIKMKKDSFGCFYASVDYERCIGCKRCEKSCPVISDFGKVFYEKPEVYAAISKDQKRRLYSTSGGIFPILAQYMIRSGGYVIGAVYDENLMVKHTITNTEDGLLPMYQSKYVQSKSGYIYRKVERVLKEGKQVLFSGTPCQISALYLYLGEKDYLNRLITCEILCVGVPAPGIYKNYIKKLERRYHSNIKKIWFKNKEQGWDQLLTRIEFQNGIIYKGKKNRDLFVKAYRENGFVLRKACYNCHFKKLQRNADITLGDFWGLKNTDFDDNNGISLVLLNTYYGKEFFEKIETDILKEKRLLKEAMRNDGLLCNMPYTWKTELYRRLYRKIPFTLLMYLTDLLK